MKVTLHPAAENDLIEAASFYELEGSAALATRFIATFKRVATLLAEQPNIGLPRTRGRRSFPMHAFPLGFPYIPLGAIFNPWRAALKSKHSSVGCER